MNKETFHAGINQAMTAEEAEELWPTPSAEERRDLLREGYNPDFAEAMQYLALRGVLKVVKRDTPDNIIRGTE